MSNQDELTTEEQATLVNFLNKFEPGPLPQAIFTAIARLIVTPTYLAIPLFEDNGVLKVQLLARELDDPYWPGQVALPGKIILSTDKTLADVYARLIKSEIPDAKIKTGPIFCGHIFEEIIRGREISLINYIILDEAPKQGKLYDVNNLPTNIV
ncbi:MAG: hypothetical protein UT32_C0035G0008 [Parcubacteria group bacterium GW2011_GWC2_39_14]|nr:MAG: hypothetical protein UT32_C0035G0008 [Parcubacteria group bacterium GW2011_GWC2_39_14]KKR53678.1 MAG: hypothetical protein UT91_C0024G0001 [Parcubacteria group bacterium GW2011_GWA2_40_23]